MLGALIIVFREVIEAGLIVGIVMAVTKGIPGSRLLVASGIAAGLVGASLAAVFAGALGEALSGIGQEVFNASILLLAVAMLTWHNVWMARHGRELATQVRLVGDAVRSGARSVSALGVVVAVAVMREGSEVALFLYGLVASSHSTSWELLTGSAAGLVLGCGVTAVTYLGLVTIPTKNLFAVTTLLITFLASGLAAQAVLFLQQGGIVTTFSQTAWDTSAVLSDTSLFGRVLHTLLGYADQPSVMQVIVYAVTLVTIGGLTRITAPRRRTREFSSNPPPTAGDVASRGSHDRPDQRSASGRA